MTSSDEITSNPSYADLMSFGDIQTGADICVFPFGGTRKDVLHYADFKAWLDERLRRGAGTPRARRLAQVSTLRVHRLNEFRGHQNRYGHLCFHRRDTYPLADDRLRVDAILRSKSRQNSDISLLGDGHCVSMFFFNQHLEHFL